jgi:hypothetical protein
MSLNLSCLRSDVWTNIGPVASPIPLVLFKGGNIARDATSKRIGDGGVQHKRQTTLRKVIFVPPLHIGPSGNYPKVRSARVHATLGSNQCGVAHPRGLRSSTVQYLIGFYTSVFVLSTDRRGAGILTPD